MAPAGIGDRVEGRHAVAAALAAGRVEHLYVERPRAEELASLIDECRRRGGRIEVVDDLEGLATSAAPQGLVALARPIRTVSLEEAASATDPPAVMVLDHLADPHNVGAVARSILAGGLRGMVVPTRRAAPLGPTAFKAAAGAFEHLGVCTVASTAEAVRRLGGLGLWTVGLSAGGERELFGLELLAEPVAIVVGSEGRGLARLVEQRLDLRVRIPMAEGVESLNASVAAALAAFETARVRGWALSADPDGVGGSGPLR